MARYIDVDKLLKEVKRGGHALQEWSTLGVCCVIERQPTADVVPKSEVAREIFEEIEDALERAYDSDKQSDYPMPHYNDYLKEYIDELKKKYTEGVTNG